MSALNHHISIVRARVPERLLGVLEGEEGKDGWERVVMWRSKWFDMYLAEERVEAMGIVWGMMAYLMRKVDAIPSVVDLRVRNDGMGEKMDTS